MVPRLGDSPQKSQNASPYTHVSNDHGAQQPLTLNIIYVFALQAGFQSPPTAQLIPPEAGIPWPHKLALLSEF